VDEFIQSGVVGNGGDLMRNALALVATCPSYQYL
jgi:hypothetical protein